MSTLISGSSGFIGSHLMKKIDAVGLSHKDIIHGHSYNCDRLFFLSTYGNMAHHKDDMMKVEANVKDLIIILKGFTGWLCYMSSSSVILPIQTAYSLTKRAAEDILKSLMPDLRACIVRPYSVTGVGEQKEHLIPTLIRSCMEGEAMMFSPFPVHDFVDVEDVVDGLLRIADENCTGIVEFGNNRPITNQEVREIVEQACGKKANAKVVTEKLRPYDNASWYCRTKHPLWKARKTLKQSIQEMVNDYKAQ